MGGRSRPEVDLGANSTVGPPSELLLGWLLIEYSYRNASAPFLCVQVSVSSCLGWFFVAGKESGPGFVADFPEFHVLDPLGRPLGRLLMEYSSRNASFPFLYV